MPAKNARVDIKTTKGAKAVLEHAAHLLGTTLSAFMLECAMTKAREVVMQAESLQLNHQESQAFMAALSRPPKPNQKLKLLFKKHLEK